MKLQFLLLIFLFTFPLFAVAQTASCAYSIKGRILDVDTREPIPYATIRVKDTEKYALTNEQGDFLIEGLCSDKNILIISCLGYTTSKREHEHDGHTHFYLTEEVTGLDEVTIQAERNKEKGTETIAQTTLAKTEIKSNPTQSLAAALSGVDGVTFRSSGSNAQLPVIHGLSGNRILILNNGLKHAFQNWGDGNIHAPEIDINSANSITVVKGAAGVRFGPEALGGAILVEANPLVLNNALYANFGAGYQTNGRGSNANFEIGKGVKKWSYFLNGSYNRIGDRRAPDFLLTNTGKEERAFSFGVLHHLNDHWDFKIYYSFIDQNFGLLRSSVTESPDLFIRAINADEPIIINPFSNAKIGILMKENLRFVVAYSLILEMSLMYEEMRSFPL